MTISATVLMDFEIGQAEKIHGHYRTVAVMADKNTENKNGDNLGYGSQKRHNGREVDAYADNPKKSG
jgi:hypothetical protein